MKRLLSLLLFAAVPVLAFPQQTTRQAEPQVPPGTKGDFAVETARVEDVFKVLADGYRFVAYVVTWHGERVVVSDPLAESDFGIGDEIRFMAGRTEFPSSPQARKLLHFQLFEHKLSQPTASR